jgi:hypothetical protein
MTSLKYKLFKPVLLIHHNTYIFLFPFLLSKENFNNLSSGYKMENHWYFYKASLFCFIESTFAFFTASTETTKAK